MNSSAIATTHLIAVNIFLLLYLVKTVLLFANVSMLEKFTRATRVIEMIISTIFLITGIWLLFILGAIKVLLIIKLVMVFASIPVAVIGFKRQNKILAVLSLLLIVGAYGISEAAKKKPFIPTQVEVNGNADDAAKLGIKTYIGNCAMCHGKDGKKMYRGAKDLSVSGLDAATVAIMVKDGVKGETGVMPAFSGTLSEEEITAVSNYVVSLRGSNQ